MAHARRDQADAHLVAVRAFERDLIDANWLVALVADGGLHGREGYQAGALVIDASATPRCAATSSPGRIDVASTAVTRGVARCWCCRLRRNQLVFARGHPRDP